MHIGQDGFFLKRDCVCLFPLVSWDDNVLRFGVMRQSAEQSPILQLSILLKLVFRNYLVHFRNYSSETIHQKLLFAIFRNYFAIFRNFACFSKYSSELLQYCRWVGGLAGLLTYLVTATVYTCLFCDLQKLFRAGWMLLFDSS